MTNDSSVFVSFLWLCFSQALIRRQCGVWWVAESWEFGSLGQISQPRNVTFRSAQPTGWLLGLVGKSKKFIVATTLPYLTLLLQTKFTFLTAYRAFLLRGCISCGSASLCQINSIASLHRRRAFLCLLLVHFLIFHFHPHHHSYPPISNILCTFQADFLALPHRLLI